MTLALVYPHQLYARNPALQSADATWLVEDPLFFTQYPFHRHKLILHRAAMQEFVARLKLQGPNVDTIQANALLTTESITEHISRAGATNVRVLDPCDDWLLRKLTKACSVAGLPLVVIPDPHFLTDPSWALPWMSSRKRFYFSEFYIKQRKALNLLVEHDGSPLGGKWSFDTENRKRLPASLVVPRITAPTLRPSVQEAEDYVNTKFPQAPGDPKTPFQYPVTHEEASAWLQEFLDTRLHLFGTFEDAMSMQAATLFHSILTPMLNIGLLTPQEVVTKALIKRDTVPLNSLEGFLRQIVGWREFVRTVYLQVGRQQRSLNALGQTFAMPRACYDGTSGILPVDTIIRRVLASGYCHHIERLMVLGNFMALIEVHPDAVYQWFMELFVDSYDWVMVPNVYGMSQYADGGLMTTKPYVSGSNYILKMSDYPKGEWCEIWDSLYWRFVSKHRNLFLRNPRLTLAVHTLDKMGDRLPRLINQADDFILRIHAS